MTHETEAAIEQREEMLRRVTNTIKLAQEAEESASGDAKKPHAHVVFVKTQRKEELERQLAELRGTKVSTKSQAVRSDLT